VFTQGGYTRDALADKRIAWGNAVTGRAAAAGVPIVAGTDALLDRDGQPALLSELELLVSGAGLTPGQAIMAATRNAAEAIGVAADRGTLESGKAADLLLLEASPLDDIRNTRKIRFVVKNGRVLFNARAK
jgi:imidazolonepropionase-like amidohydrolase